jgi:diguanylate cyclase (GGDEF)-like protein/PAS domain S-box-containing protein
LPENVNSENRTMILIAGNGSGISAALKDAMDEAGFLTFSASDIMAIIRRCTAGQPDLVLLDAFGSGSDCCATCRVIRSMPECMYLPILVVSEAGDVETSRMAFNAGATDVIGAPVVPEFLFYKMQYLIRQGRLVTSLAMTQRQLAGAQCIARVGNWDFNPASGLIHGSAEMYRILGVPRQSDTMTFESFMLAVHSADRHRVVSTLVDSSRRKLPCSIEFQTKGSDTTERTLRLVCQVDDTAPGEAPCMKGTLQDISDIRGEEKCLRLLKQAVDCLPTGVTLSDVEGRIIYSNPAEAEIHGYTYEEFVSREAILFATQSHGKLITPDQVESHGVLRRECITIKKSGEEFPVQLTSIAVRNADGRCTGILTTCEDISRQKDDELKIRKLAYFDPLTGLPNREMFFDRFVQALALAVREQRKLCLVFLDLDNFKEVNDSHGHDIGDRLLCEVAQRLAGTMRDSDTLARFGGDEFVLLLTTVTNQDSPALAAQRILSVFSRPFEIAGRQLYSSASVGLALYPDDGIDAESLFKCADTAMYHAKNEGKSRYHFFSEEMNLKSMRRVALEKSLRQGLEKDEFFLYYQPKWDVKSSRMLGAEVLLRWRSPEFGLVNPSEFIVLTESTGLICDLGHWVLRSACTQLKHWTMAGHRNFKVAVNISSKQLRRPDFYEMVEAIVRESGIDSSALELEFTESVIMEQAEISVNTLESLRKLGVQLSIDDFGTGYSSLNNLKNFPIDRINIDRSFVADVNLSKEAAALVEAIITMGHSLNLKVLAEGVENGDQLRYLTKLGCDEVQGYYLALPMTAADLVQKMSRSNDSPFDLGSLAGIRDDDALMVWPNDLCN